MAGSTWKPVLADPTPNGNQGSRTRLRNGYIFVRMEATAVEIRRRGNARQDDPSTSGYVPNSEMVSPEALDQNLAIGVRAAVGHELCGVAPGRSGLHCATTRSARTRSGQASQQRGTLRVRGTCT